MQAFIQPLKTLLGVPQEKGTVNQFKAYASKNGAKQGGEMNWMDWDSFVEGKESLTKGGGARMD